MNQNDPNIGLRGSQREVKKDNYTNLIIGGVVALVVLFLIYDRSGTSLPKANVPPSSTSVR
jgi:hypothetical protein